jgi:hypothetical protein
MNIIPEGSQKDSGSENPNPVMMEDAGFGSGNPRKSKARKSGFASPVQKNDSGGVDIKVDSKF